MFALTLALVPLFILIEIFLVVPRHDIQDDALMVEEYLAVTAPARPPQSGVDKAGLQGNPLAAARTLGWLVRFAFGLAVASVKVLAKRHLGTSF